MVKASLDKAGVLGLIIAMHIAVFYIMQAELIRRIPVEATTMPREITAVLITPEPAAVETPKPEAPKPKAQPAAAKPLAPKPKKVVAKKEKPAPSAPPTPIAKPAATPEMDNTPITNNRPAESLPPPAAAAVPASAMPPVAAPVAAQSTSAVQSTPKTVSGVEYIRAPAPEYPRLSKRMGEEGEVLLKVLVNQHGRAERVDIKRSSGSPQLDEAARLAAMQALFKPHMEDGRPTAVYAVIPIKFAIE